MSVQPTVRVQRDDFDTAAEVATLSADSADIGAVVTFTGLCRDEHGTLAALELEHYPGMAEAEIRRIADRAMERWPLDGMTVIHRFGRIRPRENIVLVAAVSRHRDAAFEGARFMMDFLKSNAPFWKREIGKDGTHGSWVDARDSDDAALKRWDESAKKTPG